MIFKKRITISMAVILCLAVLSTVISQGYEYIAASSTHKEHQVIILDAGHGGLLNTTD